MAKNRPSHKTFYPGPWRVERSEDKLVRFNANHMVGGKPSIAIWAPSGDGFFHEVALVSGDDIDTANLIAAAPVLYAELKRLVHALEQKETTGLGIPGIAILNAARAALNRVDGR